MFSVIIIAFKFETDVGFVEVLLRSLSLNDKPHFTTKQLLDCIVT